MKKMPLYLSSALVILLFTPIMIMAQPTIYLVRHAEKVPQWVGGNLDSFHPLSQEGVATSKRIAKYFESKTIDAIYCSETTRTLHTALPLSQAKEISIQTARACMDTSAIDAFLRDLQSRFDKSKMVVLFSHSNIIPYFMIKAGLPENCRAQMEIVKSDRTSWLLIEGYEHIWEITSLSASTKTCGGFQRIRF